MPTDRTESKMPEVGLVSQGHSPRYTRLFQKGDKEENRISMQSLNPEYQATRADVSKTDSSAEGFPRIGPATTLANNSRQNSGLLNPTTPGSVRGTTGSRLSNSMNHVPVMSGLEQAEVQIPAGAGDFIELVQEGHKPLAAELRAVGSQSLLSPEIAPALAQADAAFAEVVAESGITNPSDPRYFDVWQRAARRSDDILRAWLGWDAFNALSVEARSAALASIGISETGKK